MCEILWHRAVWAILGLLLELNMNDNHGSYCAHFDHCCVADSQVNNSKIMCFLLLVMFSSQPPALRVTVPPLANDLREIFNSRANSKLSAL